jgi:outer membrane protein TolC
MIALLAALLISPAQGAERALSLGDAVQAALKEGTAPRTARERVEEGDAGVSLAWSAFFPVINADAAYSYRKDPLNIGNPLFGGEPYNLYGFDLKATQPIFHGGGEIASLAVARKESEIRGHELRIAERDATLKTIAAFYDTVLHQARLASFEGQLTSQKELLRETGQRQKIGRSQMLDLLQIRTQVALLEPRISQERNQMETSSAQLATLIGERQASSLRLKGGLATFDSKPVIEEAAASATALPELAKAEAQEAEAGERRTVVNAKNWPSLDLVGTWGRSSYVKSELFDESSTQWNMGLQVTIPLFSGLSSWQERRQLASQERQAEIEATRARDQSALDQVTAKKSLETATNVLDSSTKAFALSRDLLKEARRMYRYSTIDYTQYLSVERDAFQAELDHEQAEHDYIQAVATYMASAGLKLDYLVRKLDQAGGNGA